MSRTTICAFVGRLLAWVRGARLGCAGSTLWNGGPGRFELSNPTPQRALDFPERAAVLVRIWACIRMNELEQAEFLLRGCGLARADAARLNLLGVMCELRGDHREASRYMAAPCAPIATSPRRRGTYSGSTSFRRSVAAPCPSRWAMRMRDYGPNARFWSGGVG